MLIQKPDISEWFKNPPESIPEELTELIDCENAFKITVLTPDFAFIYDKNLKDVHAVFNYYGETWLYMNGKMDAENYAADNAKENAVKLFNWMEKKNES